MTTVFDSPQFTLLNANKARLVRTFRAHGSALTAGLRDGLWRAPFSAPFASITGAGDTAAFARFFSESTGGKFAVTLPPAAVYGGLESVEAIRAVAARIVTDFNYHYDLARFDEYETHLADAARRNHRRAMAGGFRLEKTDDIDGVYNFIARHHSELGYRMAMTAHDVRITASVLPVDFFYVRDASNTVVGAAIYYRTAPGVAQLINWGDDLTRRRERITNFMAYAIFGYYKQLDFKTIDLGPASTDGIRNEGLIRFKLSLGAEETPKFTFYGK